MEIIDRERLDSLQKSILESKLILSAIEDNNLLDPDVSFKIDLYLCRIKTEGSIPNSKDFFIFSKQEKDRLKKALEVKLEQDLDKILTFANSLTGKRMVHISRVGETQLLGDSVNKVQQKRADVYEKVEKLIDLKTQQQYKVGQAVVEEMQVKSNNLINDFGKFEKEVNETIYSTDTKITISHLNSMTKEKIAKISSSIAEKEEKLAKYNEAGIEMQKLANEYKSIQKKIGKYKFLLGEINLT